MTLATAITPTPVNEKMLDFLLMQSAGQRIIRHRAARKKHA
jgi:hypothetical protein